MRLTSNHWLLWSGRTAPAWARALNRNPNPFLIDRCINDHAGIVSRDIERHNLWVMLRTSQKMGESLVRRLQSIVASDQRLVRTVIAKRVLRNYYRSVKT